jgi:hypothetical protein
VSLKQLQDDPSMPKTYCFTKEHIDKRHTELTNQRDKEHGQKNKIHTTCDGSAA